MKTTTFEKIIIGFIGLVALATFGMWAVVIGGIKSVCDHGLKTVIENVWNGSK